MTAEASWEWRSAPDRRLTLRKAGEKNAENTQQVRSGVTEGSRPPACLPGSPNLGSDCQIRACTSQPPPNKTPEDILSGLHPCPVCIPTVGQHTRACTYTRTHTCMHSHTCMHALAHTHTHVHALTHIHALTHAHTCVHALTRTHLHALTHTHTHACMHALAHTHTHVHALTRTHSHILSRSKTVFLIPSFFLPTTTSLFHL